MRQKDLHKQESLWQEYQETLEWYAGCQIFIQKVTPHSRFISIHSWPIFIKVQKRRNMTWQPIMLQNYRMLKNLKPFPKMAAWQRAYRMRLSRWEKPWCYLIQYLWQVKLLLKSFLHCSKSNKKRFKEPNKTTLNLNSLLLSGIYFCWVSKQQPVIQSTNQNCRETHHNELEFRG